jgi:hypothetical protein
MPSPSYPLLFAHPNNKALHKTKKDFEPSEMDYNIILTSA